MSRTTGLVATSSQTVGPFFHFGLATNEALGCIAPAGVVGERMRLRVRVIDGDGAPVPDALVEIYQADAAGVYPAAAGGSSSAAAAGADRPVPAVKAFTGFGRLPTDPDGTCLFETIKPGAVGGGGGADQAPHFNVCLLARGLLRQIYTRIYLAGDGRLAADPILSLVPAGRRATLLASEARGQAGTWEFVLRLQGEHETVFFDL